MNSTKIDTDGFEYIRMDAMVAEMTTSSPLTYDIYGFCGVSIVSEFFPHGDVEQMIVPGRGYMKKEDLHDEKELQPQNKLTGKQKLVIALNMARGVAALHGYKGGLIIHDDIQLSQFLLTADKTAIKLNDFNRAEFPLYDEANNQYCTYKNGHGHGNVSALSLDLPVTFLGFCRLTNSLLLCLLGAVAGT